MKVQTTRFGEVEAGNEMTFPDGLLGFTDYTRYVLLQSEDGGAFYWLQSIDAAELAFVVTDPCIWVKDYEVPICRDQMEEIGIGTIEEACVLVIVNNRGRTITCNMKGPLIVNGGSGKGIQLVTKDWPVDFAILEYKEQP